MNRTAALAVFVACVCAFSAQPTLAVTKCSQTGSSYSYTESVTSTTRTIVTNHCSNAPTYNMNPNYSVSTTTTMTIPAKPILLGATSTQSPTTSGSTASLNLSAQGGSVGVFFDGAMLYSPYGGSDYGTTTGFTTSATYAEGNTFDQCGGHSSSSTTASYHHHVPPPCLLKQLGASTTAHSPQIGWAADGFPLYGPYGPSGTLMQTCTVTGGTYGTAVCTDDCGGYYLADNTIDNYSYRYYIQGEYETTGALCDSQSCPSPGATTHPHTPMCFRGCCPSDVTCSFNVPTCSGTQNDGFTSSFTPSLTTTFGTNMAAGLSQNTIACSCSSIACPSTTCTSQTWKTTTCNTSGATNDCSPASVRSPLSLAALCAVMASVVAFVALA